MCVASDLEARGFKSVARAVRKVIPPAPDLVTANESMDKALRSAEVQPTTPHLTEVLRLLTASYPPLRTLWQECSAQHARPTPEQFVDWACAQLANRPADRALAMSVLSAGKPTHTPVWYCRLAGVVPEGQRISINYRDWSTAACDARLLSLSTLKFGSFKHASQASFFELAPPIMHGLGVAKWPPDQYAYGRVLRFFFIMLPTGPDHSDVHASMFAEVSIFARGVVDDASGLPTIDIDRVLSSPRIIPANLLITPIIAAPLPTHDEVVVMASARKSRSYLGSVDPHAATRNAKTRRKVRQAQANLLSCARDLKTLGGTTTRLILGSTITLN